ncbi:MAG: undecaprenyl-diphosphate phosphatase [Oscillospiraceae bacterium]|jgi:undecaprenyl-diphosphatase|nr:undecaprenyl-diphosphate phosphatase [Oscillospiraceae bacterium]
MSVLLALFFGIITAAGAYIPASVSGHLSLFEKLFSVKLHTQSLVLLGVMLETASLGAIIIVYRRDILQIARDTAAYINPDTRPEKIPQNVRTAFLLTAATAPLVPAIFLLRAFQNIFLNFTVVSLAFIVSGVVIYAAEKMTSPGKKKASRLGFGTALLLGLAQVAALIPGLSRLAVTTSAARAAGIEKESALRFSYLLSIPAIFGSLILSVVSAVRAKIDWSVFPAYFAGFAVALVLGVFAIRFAQRVWKSEKLVYSAYYSAGLGILIFLGSLLF